MASRNLSRSDMPACALGWRLGRARRAAQARASAVATIGISHHSNADKTHSIC